MLPKEKRLRNEKDFKRVYMRGSFFAVPLFSVNFMPNRTAVSRVGMVIGKKIASKATVRNKVKRQFREAVHANYDVLGRGYDIIFNIKKDSLEATYQTIEKEVAKALKRISEK